MGEACTRRELAAAMEVERDRLSPAEILARTEHEWAAWERRENAFAECRRLRGLLRGVSVGVAASVGSGRARMLVRRARCLVGRADVIHLVERFAALYRRGLRC